MLKLNYFLADIFILSAEKQPIKLSWRKIEWLRKRAERSIGFSPLIPAKQVHTGGNPFFISVTDIHTVSFGNNLLYLLAGYILL